MKNEDDHEEGNENEKEIKKKTFKIDQKQCKSGNFDSGHESFHLKRSSAGCSTVFNFSHFFE